MNSPAFQFYASDFLTSTQSWDVNEVGIYIRLLSNQWVNFRLPKEPERLARIAGCDHEIFKKAWVILGFKFIEGDDGFLRNQRLEVVRAEKDVFLEKQRLNGLKGGRPKKINPKHNPNVTQPITQMKPKRNPNESSSSSLIDINIYSDFSFFNNGFDKIWKDYLKMRVAIKKKATTEAELLSLKKLSKLSNDDKELAIKIVEQSIQNSWQGLFELKTDFKQQNNYSSDHPLISEN